MSGQLAAAKHTLRKSNRLGNERDDAHVAAATGIEQAEELIEAGAGRTARAMRAAAAGW